MIEGLKSKNNRTRIECVENVEFMIEQCGIEVMCDSSQPDVFVALSIMSWWSFNIMISGNYFLGCYFSIYCYQSHNYLLFKQIVGSTKSLQSIAAFTVERDGDIRKAALQTLATAYKVLGIQLASHSIISYARPCWLSFVSPCVVFNVKILYSTYYFIAGEDIWRFVGKLSSAQKGVMDEKFKWTVSSIFCHCTMSLVLNHNIARTETVIAKVESHWLKFLLLPI